MKFENAEEVPQTTKKHIPININNKRKLRKKDSDCESIGSSDDDNQTK